MTGPEQDPAPRIWALLGAHAGDNNQVIALAEALQLPFETRHLEYNHLRHLGPRLLGSSLISLAAPCRRAILAEKPPDVTISSGHRSVAVARALRQRSGGRTRSIHVGFPRVSPRHFDLVIATPQYPIADHPNLLRVTYALTRAATSVADAADGPQLARLRHPRALLLVGGPSLYWRVDGARTIAAVAAMLDEARRQAGSVMVTTSPRTPRDLRDKIALLLKASDVPTVLTGPGERPSYASLLDAADSIRITADSVSMVSDAIWTGKPVALVAVGKSLLGWLVCGVMTQLHSGRPLYPQDLRSFWQALEHMGVTEHLATPAVSTDDELRTVIGRARHVVESRS